MKFIVDFFTNPCILARLTAWILSQILKTVTHLCTQKTFDWRRLLGDGGMPSSHTATVTAQMTACGLTCGLNSPEFAVSFILAVVVCRDAVGIRRETEKQARVLNAILETMKEFPKQPLNVFVGHTPFQVGAGILIGVVNALVMHDFVFG